MASMTDRNGWARYVDGYQIEPIRFLQLFKKIEKCGVGCIHD